MNYTIAYARPRAINISIGITIRSPDADRGDGD